MTDEISAERLAEFTELFIRNLRDAQGDDIPDTVALAVICNCMGDLIAFHAAKGCCNAIDLMTVAVLNLRQGYRDHQPETPTAH